MWVSGSLIISRTWRSSSVSWPIMTRSIFFFSSWLRSRTRRGSFDQALPIGCMRVFMTPSCSSDVTWLRRCKGAANSLSFCLRRICRTWLRVSTSSLTMVIRFSSNSTLTRMLWLATALSFASPPSALAASALTGFADFAGAASASTSTGASIAGSIATSSATCTAVALTGLDPASARPRISSRLPKMIAIIMAARCVGTSSAFNAACMWPAKASKCVSFMPRATAPACGLFRSTLPYPSGPPQTFDR